MKTVLIRNIPDKIHRKFKVHCAEAELSQNDVLIRLMEMEAEGKILYNTIDKEDKKK